MFKLLYVANPDRKTAKKMALQLLKKRLAACTNCFPIESTYRWKGKIERGKEWVLMVKTKKAAAAEKEIKRIHPYSVPCIIRLSVSANREYEKWLKKGLL